ncbi:hypothetical protein QE364_003190 [Nocardioides zeae]|uniref:Uncharacterized protein n=2 Tax=Nocardioides zeae TaxID=1457234 RepID=A0AAJ1U5G9_9ACTN|nr:hypothetical protein [Nocardioides zeae]MDQ1106335.1 hypothetical protein [Nocardioides zeae]MDR6173979.1 hypothetical protein [Nocardioides zeae]MDR6211466.1 hypothetical protein [Nocardioides zeae]
MTTSDVPAARATRRTLVRTAAWAVPAVSVVAAAPAFAVSGGTSRFVVQQTRYLVVGEPVPAEYRLDVTITGAPIADARIVWTPRTPTSQTIGLLSSNLTHVSGDYFSEPTMFIVSGTSFWFTDGLADSADGSCTLQLLDGTTLLETLVVTYDSSLAPQPYPGV